MQRAARPPQAIAQARTVMPAPNGRRPGKAELAKKFDMPGMSDDELRDTLFRRFNCVREPGCCRFGAGPDAPIGNNCQEKTEGINR